MKLLYVIIILAGALQMAHAEKSAIRLELDASQAPTGVLHSHLTIPASAGPLTLAYPKWIPGEHAPGGPFSQVVNLKFTAGGRPLAWKRDDLDIFVFHLEVPSGVNEIEADLDFACVVGAEGFRSDVCSSQNQLVVNWWDVALYPTNLPNDDDPFTASVRLPAGWKFSTALPKDQELAGNTVVYKTVSLKTLVDSPLIAAEHLRVIALGGRQPAELDISSATAEGLDLSAKQIDNFKRLVAEAEALFDGPRYQHYNLLLSLGDDIDHYTLEHFESSENRLPGKGLLDARILFTTASMIPHEYIHSWNGKYHTPSGLDIRTYQDPMKASLIWVYEGLTDYLGNILAARSGFWTEEQLAQSLAIDAAQMTYHTGRTWRPLQDTTVGVQMLYNSPNAWSSARRNADFYPESGLIWLEADTIIREQSHGQRTLDDFCRLFFGPDANTRPYSFDDVMSGLNQIQPYGWKSFFRTRLDSTDPQPPLGGLERSGWRLIYDDKKSELISDMEQIHKIDLLWPEWQRWSFSDLRYSIGLLLQDDGTVLDSAPGMAGYNAGIMPGMRLTAINGARFSIAALEDAVRRTANGKALEFAVANGAATGIHKLDYRQGLKYPHLERDASRPDILQKIAAPAAQIGGS